MAQPAGVTPPARKTRRGLLIGLGVVGGACVLCGGGALAWVVTGPARLEPQADAILTAARTNLGNKKFVDAADPVREFIVLNGGSTRAPEMRTLLTETYTRWLIEATRTRDARMLATVLKETDRGYRDQDQGIGEVIKPALAEAQFTLGQIQREQGNAPDAVATLKKAQSNTQDPALLRKIQTELATTQLGHAQTLFGEIQTKQVNVLVQANALKAALNDVANMDPQAASQARWQLLRNATLPERGTLHYISKRTGNLRHDAEQRTTSNLSMDAKKVPRTSEEHSTLPGIQIIATAREGDSTDKSGTSTYTSMRMNYQVRLVAEIPIGFYDVKLTGTMSDPAPLGALNSTRAVFDFVLWVDD